MQTKNDQCDVEPIATREDAAHEARDMQILLDNERRELAILAEDMARGKRVDTARLGKALLAIAPAGSRLPDAKERQQERQQERRAS